MHYFSSYTISAVFTWHFQNKFNFILFSDFSLCTITQNNWVSRTNSLNLSLLVSKLYQLQMKNTRRHFLLKDFHTLCDYCMIVIFFSVPKNISLHSLPTPTLLPFYTPLSIYPIRSKFFLILSFLFIKFRIFFQCLSFCPFLCIEK